MSRVSRLLMLIGVLALGVAAVGIGMGFLLVKNGLSARERPSAVESVVATTIRHWSVPAREKERRSPVSSTAEVLAAARAHWADHCAICHANDGSGETEMGRNLYPKPPDMRQAATQAQSDGELYYVIQNGVRLTGMPAWGAVGHDDEESWGLVAFIRMLPKLTSADVKEMEELNPRSAEMDRERDEEAEFLKQPDAEVSKGHKGSHR